MLFVLLLVVNWTEKSWFNEIGAVEVVVLVGCKVIVGLFDDDDGNWTIWILDADDDVVFRESLLLLLLLLVTAENCFNTWWNDVFALWWFNNGTACCIFTIEFWFVFENIVVLFVDVALVVVAGVNVFNETPLPKLCKLIVIPPAVVASNNRRKKKFKKIN